MINLENKLFGCEFVSVAVALKMFKCSARDLNSTPPLEKLCLTALPGKLSLLQPPHEQRDIQVKARNSELNHLAISLALLKDALLQVRNYLTYFAYCARSLWRC